jgi:hypothetical protein
MRLIAHVDNLGHAGLDAGYAGNALLKQMLRPAHIIDLSRLHRSQTSSRHLSPKLRIRNAATKFCKNYKITCDLLATESRMDSNRLHKTSKTSREADQGIRTSACQAYRRATRPETGPVAGIR